MKKLDFSKEANFSNFFIFLVKMLQNKIPLAENQEIDP
jgi:hypothetical protein